MTASCGEDVWRMHRSNHTGDRVPSKVVLDLSQKSMRAEEFSRKLRARIVGQDEAVDLMSDLFQIFLAGMTPPTRPVGTILFLGPTGSGKTRVAEAVAEVLLGDPRAVVKIDCAEFQHSHEIAKLIGSPPGYIGHRETSPLLSQENLDRHHRPDMKLSIVLFDEIEKASDALWQLLLGILDKATLNGGDNRQVNFSRSIVIMTSNLGAKAMSDIVSGGIGFGARSQLPVDESRVNQQITHAGLEAARRKFSPEFMNRIDRTVIFRSLVEDDLRGVLELELRDVQQRLLRAAPARFLLRCTAAAKEVLLKDGIDLRYGARHLKRAIEKRIVLPLASLMATEQVNSGDVVDVDVDASSGELIFSKHFDPALVSAELAETGSSPQAVHSDGAAGGEGVEEIAAQIAVATAVIMTAAIAKALADQKVA
jgi:ATP-dependent Clp protease ATP-binding subunit ClpB